MKDFWIACGHHLLDRDTSGRLVVTDEFLKAYLARPELMPPEDACAAERRLHQQLLANPRLPVSPQEVAVVADGDARENWKLVLAFRDLLLGHSTLEAAYLTLIRSGAVDLPPLFVNQLVHAILRNALDGCEDPFVPRAAELFFRPQRLIPHEYSLLLGDDEIIGGHNRTPVVSLLSLMGANVGTEMDVLDDGNADAYWQRSDQFDLAFDLTGGTRGPVALGEAITRWIAHLLGVKVVVEPVTALTDAKLTWYVGLDAEATRIGDRLWRGDALDKQAAGRVLALFRLGFADADLVLDVVGCEPVYLILAMTSDQLVRVKPQNLLTGLPIKHLETAT